MSFVSRALMSSSSILCLALVGAACAGAGGPAPARPDAAPQPAACLASPAWITSQSPPTEIGGGVPVGEETNCQFYQFSWQWFLNLAQPIDTSGERRFEGFRVFQPGAKDQCQLGGVTGRASLQKALFVRTKKVDDAGFDPVLPEDIKQATGEALYDQSGNVVLYTIHYNPIECEATSAGFKPNTIEIKASWRILQPTDPALGTYYNINATIPAISPKPLTLGLVGFHLVINTADHPEFVWATFEHKSNAPDCTSPAPAPAAGWSFTSAACAQCITTQPPSQCTQCGFNTGVASTSLTGKPNEVCRVYEDGTDPGSRTGGNDNDTNRANIDALNEQLVGPSGFLTALPASDPMAVFQNYQLVGGLWTNGGVSSTAPDAQRGSLELANTTMETFFQQQGQNCFTCHTYDPSKPLAVSHIADDLFPAAIPGK